MRAAPAARFAMLPHEPKPETSRCCSRVNALGATLVK
jgi:hypothetical protein